MAFPSWRQRAGLTSCRKAALCPALRSGLERTKNSQNQSEAFHETPGFLHSLLLAGDIPWDGLLVSSRAWWVPEGVLLLTCRRVSPGCGGSAGTPRSSTSGSGSGSAPAPPPCRCCSHGHSTAGHSCHCPLSSCCTACREMWHLRTCPPQPWPPPELVCSEQEVAGSWSHGKVGAEGT